MENKQAPQVHKRVHCISLLAWNLSVLDWADLPGAPPRRGQQRLSESVRTRFSRVCRLSSSLWAEVVTPVTGEYIELKKKKTKNKNITRYYNSGNQTRLLFPSFFPFPPLMVLVRLSMAKLYINVSILIIIAIESRRWRRVGRFHPTPMFADATRKFPSTSLILILFYCLRTKREDGANTERGAERLSLHHRGGVAEHDSSIFRSLSTEYLK